MARSFAESTSVQVEALLCEELGFVKKYGVLWKHISEGVRGFLGLGRATYGASNLVDIWPTVGIRFDAVYRLEVELEASPDTKTGCNFAVRLKYLVPNKAEYSFRKDQDNTSTAARMVSDVKNYALPFYDEFSSLKLAIPAVAQSKLISGRHTFVPTAYHFLGDTLAALSHAQEYGRGFDPRRHSGAQYHRFIENLRNAQANRA